VAVDADGLAFLVVDEVDLGDSDQHRLAVAHFKLGLDARAHHLLGRHPIDLLDPGAHELDAATRDDVGLEAVGPEMVEQLEHRLIDELGVGAVELGVARGGQPPFHDLLELGCGHPGMRGHHQLEQTVLAGGRHRFEITFQDSLEGLLLFPFRVLSCQGLDPVDGEQELEVDRFLRPQGAVVVEDGDPLGFGDELGGRRVGDPNDKIENGLSGGTIVPGG
jgi:hypothetical protein